MSVRVCVCVCLFASLFSAVRSTCKSPFTSNQEGGGAKAKKFKDQAKEINRKIKENIPFCRCGWVLNVV